MLSLVLKCMCYRIDSRMKHFKKWVQIQGVLVLPPYDTKNEKGKGEEKKGEM